MNSEGAPLVNLEKFGVANTIIEFSNANGHAISSIQLQEILFFLQAHWLLYKKRELVSGTFSRTKVGPLIRPLAKELKHHGAELLTKAEPIFLVSEYDYVTPRLAIEQYDKRDLAMFHQVIRSLLTYSMGELVALARSESLFSDYYQATHPDQATDYSDYDIQAFFSKHPEEVFWQRDWHMEHNVDVDPERDI